MFNHQGPDMIRVMCNLMVRVFEHLEITPKMDIDKRINYTERILGGLSLKEYIQVIAECKESVKGIAGDQWDMGATNNVTT